MQIVSFWYALRIANDMKPTWRQTATLVLLFPLTYLLNYLLTYSLTYLLTQCRKVLLDKVNGTQLVKKFPALYGT